MSNTKPIIENPFGGNYDVNDICYGILKKLDLNANLTLELVIGFVYYELPDIHKTMYQVITVLNSMEYDVFHNTNTVDFIFKDSEFYIIKKYYKKYLMLDDNEKLRCINVIRKALKRMGYASEYTEGVRFVIEA